MTVQHQSTRSYTQTYIKISWFQHVNDLSKTSWWWAFVLHKRKETVRNKETFLQVDRHLCNIHVTNGNIKNLKNVYSYQMMCMNSKMSVWTKKISKFVIHYEFLTERIR
jgi:hypothetical protein